jgi:hypothetical protein
MTSSFDPSLEKADVHSEQKMNIQQGQMPATADAEIAEKIPTETDSESASLPSVDGGIQAWLFLAGCYMMELLVFGTLDRLRGSSVLAITTSLLHKIFPLHASTGTLC